MKVQSHNILALHGFYYFGGQHENLLT